MNNILLDSSVLVSAFSREELESRGSQRLLEVLLAETTPYTITLPRLVIIESYVALSRKLGDHDANRGVSEMVEKRNDVHVLELDSVVQKTVEMLTPKLALKTSNLIIVSSAYLTNATLITLDKKMEKEASKVINAKTPNDFLSTLSEDTQ